MFLNFNYITCSCISESSGVPSIIVKTLPQVNIYNNILSSLLGVFLIKAVHSAFRCSTAVSNVLNCETSNVASEFTLLVSAPDTLSVFFFDFVQVVSLCHLWTDNISFSMSEHVSHWGNFGA